MKCVYFKKGFSCQPCWDEGREGDKEWEEDGEGDEEEEGDEEWEEEGEE